MIRIFDFKDKIIDTGSFIVYKCIELNRQIGSLTQGSTFDYAVCDSDRVILIKGNDHYIIKIEFK